MNYYICVYINYYICKCTCINYYICISTSGGMSKGTRGAAQAKGYYNKRQKTGHLVCERERSVSVSLSVSVRVHVRACACVYVYTFLLHFECAYLQVGMCVCVWGVCGCGHEGSCSSQGVL